MWGDLPRANQCWHAKTSSHIVYATQKHCKSAPVNAKQKGCLVLHKSLYVPSYSRCKKMQGWVNLPASEPNARTSLEGPWRWLLTQAGNKCFVQPRKQNKLTFYACLNQALPSQVEFVKINFKAESCDVAEYCEVKKPFKYVLGIHAYHFFIVQEWYLKLIFRGL